MKFSRKESTRGEAEIPLTSLTDIMFLLLIFFMVTTTFQASSGIQVKLPASSAQMPDEKIERVVVSIKEGGGVYFDNTPVEDAALESAFEKIAGKNKNALVVIRADKKVVHGRVVMVMEAARVEGLTRIAIATVQRAER